ncbi:unnamed protein product (macronuclear) [Paramecium tetraurelia]|uniref:Uncharacterized protein n=1 Tax=Paramecium tetraurelia TaxID=5888 RepID=A0BU59_PARTE|nr:uncharacterized protein GSPATT00032308001 [Paramecium tetraurelia]CAK62076.1 unnamed protein product [Paramecium tetraurelia]|eukprot:XP_001429474.1 hypothetical protein (macronuclear) [Paramecium tetraurelia strain d4-2]
MRAKDDTIILDVQLYLEQQHENKCVVTLYLYNEPIKVDKNTYLLPFLQKHKIQQLDYKTDQKTDLNRLYQSDIGIEDEGPGLDLKLNERDSSSWGLNLSRLKKSYLSGETNDTLIQQISPRNQQEQLPCWKASQNNSSTQSSVNMGLQQEGKSDNDSQFTIKSIECRYCKQSYNSQELKTILVNAIKKNVIALCQMCYQKIPRSMYSKIKVADKEYHYIKLSLELEILKKDLIQKMDIQKCQFCNFFCIWDKRKQSINRFCPNCLQNSMISKNY